MKDTQSPAASAPAPVGARHDDSSLFSLDALKKTEEEAARQQQKQAEDSGLIDLKALALIAQDQRPRQDMGVAAMVAPPDLFAVSSPIAPITAPHISTGPAPLDPSVRQARTRALVAAGAAVAVLAAIGAFAFTRGSSSAATAPSVKATAAPPPAVTAPAVPDEPRAAAITPGERPAPPPKEEPKAAPTATAAPRPAVAAAPRGPAPRPAAPKEEAAPKPPVDACDLACQMARAVNKKK